MKIGTDDHDAALMRLRDILDAYGGDPDRWPDAEREPALALLARSADARRLCDEALRLDAVLDLLPAAEPSPDLEERIVAAARQLPQETARPVPASLDDARLRRAAARPPRRGLLLAAALPLAAAAALALWIVRAEHTQPQQVAATQGARSRQVATTRAPDATSTATDDASEAELLAALASYHTPGDALLELSGLDDVYDADPWHGCSEGDLGCVKNDTLPLEPVSQRAANEVRILS